MKRRGIGLGVTLVIVALLATVGFTLAALTVSRLQLLSNLQQKRKAHSLALSAIEAALNKLQNQPNYGIGGGDPLLTVTGDNPGNQGRILFDLTRAQQLGLQASQNNLQGLTALTTPHNVPAASARLIGDGRYGSAHEVVEALITQPVYPFALASTGPLHSNQGLIVASLDDNTPQGRLNLLADPARYGKPANLLSNAATLDSVQILGPSTICGDLQSSGKIDLSGNPITVLGELREDQDSGSIPDIPLTAVDPTLLGMNPQIIAAAPSNSPTINGAVVCNGPFRVNGDLNLNGGLLYVKGDLEVGGTVMGSGSLVCEGSMHLHGSADLSSTERIAVVSKGDLTLDGNGPTQSYFRGILYTRGKLTAHGIMVFGCLLGAAPGPPSGPQIDLQDCVLLQDTQPQGIGASSVVNTRGEVTDSGMSSSYPLRESVQVVGPGRLRLVANLELSMQPGIDVTVDIYDPNSRAQFVAKVLQRFPQAARISIGTKPMVGTGQQPPNTGPFANLVDLPLAPQFGNLTGQLEEVVRRMEVTGNTPSSGLNLNQFLRPSERLRVASCRTIH